MDTTVTEQLVPKRELKDGKWHQIHCSADGRVRVDTGPDDQRPNHDGVLFFRPTMVEHYPRENGPCFNRQYFCGKCLSLMEPVRKHCPECGAGIANYVCAMGFEKYIGEHLPDKWENHAKAKNLSA
jgi:hypothetical protein